jgi:hypothetical protein
MTVSEAIMIAEGAANAEDISEERYLKAWQLLVDTGVAYQLQGWFGRQANSLIEAGVINGRAA